MKGKCCYCHKLTSNQEKFADDWDEDENGNVTASSLYLDWCHEECYEYLQDKIQC